jgi:hypothetical protein
MRLKGPIILTVLTMFLLATSTFAVVQSTTLQFEDQWTASGHNYDPSVRTQSARASCVPCHNSEWYIRIQIKGEAIPTADLAKPPEYGHTCKTCHENENPTNILALRKVGDAILPAHNEVISAGVSAGCMSCHNSRRVNPDEYVKLNNRGTHDGPQAEMLSGTGAVTYGETFGSSMHTNVTPKGCVTCHLDGAPAEGERGYNQIGGHTFKMYSDSGTPENTRDDVENIAVCQQCHPTFTTFNVPAKGDYDGNGKVEGVQTEVNGLLTLIAAELPKDPVTGLISLPSGDVSKLATPEEQKIAINQRSANYNYVFVKNDGSFGIHNTAFAVQVLRTSYEKLTGKKLAGDTIKAVSLPAPVRPKTDEAIENRLAQWKASPHNFDPAVVTPSEEASCVKCHNSEWFVKIQVKGEAPPAANLAEPPTYGHTCYTCHDTENPTDMLSLRMTGKVTLPAYNDVIEGGVSASCMACHNARRVDPAKLALTSRSGAHRGPQADILSGTGGISYGKKMESSSHFTAVEKKCVGCHMADTPAKGKPGHNIVGEHSFSVRSLNGTPDDPKDDIQNVAVCQKCHTGITSFDFPAGEDYDGNGKFEGVQTEVKGMLAILANALPHDDKGVVTLPSDLTLTTVDQRMANFNYTLVLNDKSNGVHNLKYAVSLLRASYKSLTGKEMLSTKASDNVFFTTLTPGLNMLSVPLKPAAAYTARSLAKELSATIVVKYDDVLQRFAAFTPEATGDGFAIEGGKGYIVNVTKAGSYMFVGSPWTNSPPTAPPVTQSENTWAFVVSGSVLNGDMMSIGDGGYVVNVKNLRTGATVAETLDARGYFAATWADLNRKAVVEMGDRVEVSVQNSSGAIVSGPFTYEVKQDQIRNTLLKVQIKLGDIIPTNAALLQNYPNPFNPETWIPYYLKDTDSVSIKVYNSTGQLIKTLDLGRKDAGVYVSRSNAAYWDGKNEAGEIVSSGIYFYTINSGKFTATKKMVIRK